MAEAKITISDVELTAAQSCTLRVAVGNMLLELDDEEFRKQIGEGLAKSYQARLGEIQTLIMRTAG